MLKLPFFVKSLLVFSLVLAVLGCASQRPPSGQAASSLRTGASAGQAEQAEQSPGLAADTDPVKALPDNLLFFDFPHGAVGLEDQGTVKSYDLAHISPTHRGNGKAVLAGFSFGLLGLAAVPAIIAANTNALKPEEAVGFMALSPDKKSILMMSPASSKSYLITLEGKRLKKLHLRGADPDYSADGRTVYFTHKEDSVRRIAVYDLKKKSTTDFKVPGTGSQWWPKLSPDGSELLYVQGEPPDGTSIAVMDMKTGKSVTLVANDLKPMHPSWGPDGSFIVYASLRDHEIHRLDLATQKNQTLTSGHAFKLYPVVTPDGKYVVYAKGLIGVRHGSIGGRFIIKWLDLATGTVRTEPMPKHPGHFSPIQSIPW